MWFNVNITKSAENELEDRLKNPFWWSFIIAWITWNWKVWYLTFFVTEEVSGNKIDYIVNMYLYFDFFNLFPFLGFILNWLIIPLILSILVFFVITEKIGHLFLKKKYELEEKEIKIKNNYLDIKSDSIDKLNDLLNKEEKVIEKEKEVEVKKEINKFEDWDRDFLKIENFTLDTLNHLIYSSRWYLWYDLIQILNIDEKSVNNQIMILDTYWLIKLKDWKTTQYEITEKGKYFLKKNILK